MTAALFTYEEVDLILRGDGCEDYVGISAIDGLIAAVVAGPAYLEPDDCLLEIFAGQVPASPPGTPNHQLVQTILHRPDEVAETLARRPNAYLPIFMHVDGRVVIEDWTVGFMLGVGKCANAWSKIILSDSVRPSRRSCRAIHWAATSCSMSRSPNSIGSRRPPTRRSTAS